MKNMYKKAIRVREKISMFFKGNLKIIKTSISPWRVGYLNTVSQVIITLVFTEIIFAFLYVVFPNAVTTVINYTFNVWALVGVLITIGLTFIPKIFSNKCDSFIKASYNEKIGSERFKDVRYVLFIVSTLLSLVGLSYQNINFNNTEQRSQFLTSSNELNTAIENSFTNSDKVYKYYRGGECSVQEIYRTSTACKAENTICEKKVASNIGEKVILCNHSSYTDDYRTFIRTFNNNPASFLLKEANEEMIWGADKTEVSLNVSPILIEKATNKIIENLISTCNKVKENRRFLMRSKNDHVQIAVDEETKKYCDDLSKVKIVNCDRIQDSGISSHIAKIMCAQKRKVENDINNVEVLDAKILANIGTGIMMTLMVFSFSLILFHRKRTDDDSLENEDEGAEE